MAMRLVSDIYNFSHHQSTVATSSYLIHQHMCYELYYIVSGNMHFLFDGSEYTLNPHTLLIIPPGALHGIHILTDATYDRYTFHFVPQLFPRERQEPLLRILPSLETVRSGKSAIPFLLEDAGRFHVQESLDRILAIPDQFTSVGHQHFFASALLEEFLIRLYLSCADSPTFVPPNTVIPDPPELANILDYLRRHPSEKISLEQLSERFFISRSQLNNLFQRHFQTSVMEYIAKQRLSYAQKLLLSGMPASEVAVTVGYSDYSTFYRAYSKHIGHPPAQDKGNENPEHAKLLHGWAKAIPFSDPLTSMTAMGTLKQTSLPDIGFKDHGYDPLE
ncbi:MAG: helix-turn-helix transcriptional regulator [Clostridia bacterium]|nr:helix-turn-helix transcriptional regulator [Clostridia bacterium]